MGGPGRGTGAGSGAGPTLRRLAGAPDLGLRVLAGADLLDRPVRWVFTTDLRDPGRYLAGGELVLTGLMWRRGAADSEEFVAAVARRGAVGLAAGAAALGQVPLDVVDACERHRLPLLEVPADVSFATLTRRVMTGRWGEPADRRGALLAAVAAGEPPLDLVAAELDRPCWIVGPTGRVLAGAGEVPAGELAGLFHRGGGRARRARAEGRAFGLAPLAVLPRSPAACFLAVEDAGDADLGGVAADLAAAVGLEAARRGGRDQAPAPSGRLVRGLLTDDRSPREIADLLADLDLGGGDVPVAVAVSVAGGGDGHAVAAYLVTDTAGGPAAVAEWQDETLALVRLDAEGRAALPARLRSAARLLTAALPGRRIAAGVSGTASSGLGPREALQEARNARRLAALAPGPAAVTSGDDVDSVDLLIASMPRGIRRRFRDGLIGELEAYDARHGAGLTATLSAFLARSGSWQRCAADLHVHVNTVRYRLRRVEELTGRDLSRFPDRVDLYLALRLAEWERPPA